jgi:hypothetical protein
VSARDAARAIAAGRVVVGAAFLVAPALAGRGWIGDDAERPGVQAIFRALGIRDLILGMLTLHVVDRPGIGARTVATCAVADAVDFTGTLLARESVPGKAAAGALVVAGGAAVGGMALAVALRSR